MDGIGKKGGLHGFEQAKNVYIEPENFQTKNILTNTMKLQRFAAKKAYVEEVKAMYDEGMLNFKWRKGSYDDDMYGKIFIK